MAVFTSDNTAGTSPEILEAVTRAATGPQAPYGNDEWSERARALLSDLFEREVDVFPTATGSAANALALSVTTPSYGSVLCHVDAHINNDEAGAPELVTTGAKIVPVAGSADAKLDLGALRAAALRGKGDVHRVQPSVVSISQTTETGAVHSVAEVEAVCAVARETGLRTHMDGARFANAVAALGCSPADVSWRAGVDVLSFGATKNGAMTADAVVVFDRALSRELAFRHKRAGQLTSKMRFQSAQLVGYLEGDLWLRNARHANAMAARLADGLATCEGVELAAPAASNILFVRFPLETISRLHAAGFAFYADRWEPGVARLVTSFGTTEQEVDALVAACR